MHAREFGLVAIFLFLLTITCAWGETVETYDGYQGAWLRTDAAEVFVATEPHFRVLAFRRIGRPSLMADANVAEQGIRLAFMEPEQVPPSFDVGNQPAAFLDRTQRTARVQLSPAAGLRYTVELELADDSPLLRLGYVLENVGDAERRIACWSVISFARDGTMIAPFGTRPRSRRQIVLPWWTRWPQPGVTFGRDALAIDCSAELDGNAYKVGLRTDCGWAAFVRGDQALISTTPFDPAGEYPEGGANITLFHSTGQRIWCETEQVGTLQTIRPGEAARLSETLRLVDLPQPVAAEPDALRAQIEAAGAP